MRTGVRIPVGTPTFAFRFGRLRLGKPSGNRGLVHCASCQAKVATAKSGVSLTETGRITFFADMAQFSYVYMLQSEADPERHYVGLTDDLQLRLQVHNKGSVQHSAQFRPWRIKTAVAFRDRSRAAEFERYLKSASGRAFAKKHF